MDKQDIYCIYYGELGRFNFIVILFIFNSPLHV